MEVPVDAPTATEKLPEAKPGVARQPGHPNLVRYAPGAKPEHLSKPRITRRTLMDDLRAVLSAKDGVRQRKLAESIVDNAIDGNAACLNFIAERLAPVEMKGGDGGRVVFEGIKLEIVGGGGGESSRTTVALVRGSESQSGVTPLNVSEAPLEISGTQDSASESQVSAPRDVTLE